MEPREPIRLGRAEKGLRIVGPTTARGRFRVILPLLRFRSAQGVGENLPVFLPSGAKALSFSELVHVRARQFHISDRAVFRWLKRFDEGGYAALADRPRKDKGQSRFFSNRPLVVAFVVVRYLAGWHVASIHEALRQSWGQLCRGNVPLPGIDTLRQFLKRMIPPRVLARSTDNG